MRQTLILFLQILSLTVSCSSPTDNRKDINETGDSLIPKIVYIKNKDSLQINQLIKKYDLNSIDTFAVGDVNGDGKEDKAII